MLESKANQRGDTLIEVLLSIAIMSMVIVGGSILMNFGMQNAINSVEHTQVRNSIVGQSELLRYLRDNAEAGGNDNTSTTWNTQLRTGGSFVTTAPPTAVNGCSPSGGRQAFYLTVAYNGEDNRPTITVRNYPGSISDSRPYAIPGRGMWLEGVASSSGVERPYIDFHIRACWQGSGGGDYQQQSNTVVRLYRQ